MRDPRLPASTRGIIILLACSLVASATAFADSHSLWTVKGKHNTVYLLGSMHLLRAGEPLPAVMEEAYRDAEKLVMEIDLDDLDPVAAQQLTMELGLLPAGETLGERLGAEASAKLDAYAQKIGIPSVMLGKFRPWFAAITLTQLHLLKLGLDPQSGIEQRFVAKAAEDRKEILGLETLAEQLHLLADLPAHLQTQFLLQSLDEVDEAEREIDVMVAAWRTGDAAALEEYTVRGMQEFPELYRPLTVDRNRRWMARLEEMLAAKQDYLVIVGALHLVGKDGVLDLLQQKNFKIQQR